MQNILLSNFCKLVKYIDFFTMKDLKKWIYCRERNEITLTSYKDFLG